MLHVQGTLSWSGRSAKRITAWKVSTGMDGWGGGRERSMAWRGRKAAEERSGCGVEERGEMRDVGDGALKRGVCGWKGGCGG